MHPGCLSVAGMLRQLLKRDTRVVLKFQSGKGLALGKALEKGWHWLFWPVCSVQSVLEASNRLCEPYVSLNEI